ncbi:uncharacterized protein PV09_07374 [Verruconis gallopava]|uniref:Uncharacterized protein n=1 Tax=Verruconis gallopava TaxID=253628 RepID=A0A0D1YJQ7_9PEZI|nr:uncharacterized protein PV09_07374 [Verruconis gallopava]KIW01087.1 hypothetical protein PV09_07374 [Verruconis gallopava]
MLAQSLSPHHDLSSNRMNGSLVVPQPPPPPPPQQQHQSPMRAQQLPSANPNRQRRPKLSLNTSQARTFGKGSSLRLETLSAVSPTAINTFANAYDPGQTSSAPTGRPTRPKLSIDSSVSSTAGTLETPEALDSRTPSSSSVSSASTLNSATIPYSISQVLNSVLANSPLQPRAQTRRMSLRPRFPVEKRVTFRTPLVEEIVNTKYTLAHIDFVALGDTDSGTTMSLCGNESPQSSSSGSSHFAESYPESTLSLEQPTDDITSPLALKTSASFHQEFPIRSRSSPHRIKTRRSSPRTGDKRDSSSESDSDSCPETPVAGRRKRRREWVWTLGDLPGQPASSGPSYEDDDDDNAKTTDAVSSFSSTSSTANE